MSNLENNIKDYISKELEKGKVEEVLREKLKERLLEIPINHRAFREKHRLANDLEVEIKEVEWLLNELCDKGILLRKNQYSCYTCNDIITISDELLKEIIMEDNCFECDNCFSLINVNKNKTGYVFYDIEDREALVNW